ncbi:MAG TPA: hypothetical protein VMV94_04005 [Phycisphaerae bacterium]|nr:hypothetical protein [Phycisphaerae bacterium]
MFRRRPVTGFFVKLIFIYGLLIAPWPYLASAYLAFFRASGNLFLSSIGPAGAVRFEHQSPPDDEWATKLSFKNRRTGAEGTLERCNARHWYLMAALVTALIVATPIRWSRKWKSLLLGLVAANVIMALGMWLNLVEVFSGDGPLAQFKLSPFRAGALNVAVRILAQSPEVPFAVPIFIWLLVTLRRGDLRQWLGVSRSPSAVSGRGQVGPS